MSEQNIKLHVIKKLWTIKFRLLNSYFVVGNSKSWPRVLGYGCQEVESFIEWSSVFIFLEFPVSEKTLARLLLNNEFESDILKVNTINSILMLLSPFSSQLPEHGNW